MSRRQTDTKRDSIPFLRNVETSGTVIEKQAGYTEKVLSAGCYRQLGRYLDFRHRKGDQADKGSYRILFQKTLFANILDELFFPVFALSADEREKLSKSTVTDFYNKYKTPFERVRDDLRDNYGVENPSQAIFNLFIQGSKHYDQFTSNVGELMQLEQDFMSRIVGGRVNNILDLNRVYVENIGNIFIESMNFDSN